MAADGSAAERKRRSRLHLRDDHSLCLPSRCDRAGQRPLLAAAVDLADDEVAPPLPVERGPRAAALWDELSGSLPPAQRLLLDEACRMADRLDRLDGLLRKRSAWMSFETEDGGRVVVVVDAVLAEARQYATALRGLLADITKALPKASQTPAPSARGSAIASLADAAARRRSAAG